MRPWILFVLLLSLAACSAIPDGAAGHGKGSESASEARTGGSSPTTNLQTSPIPSFLRSWYDFYDGDTVKHTVDLNGVISGGVPKDGIPSIDGPRFVSKEEAASFLQSDDRGILITLGEESRFYPLRILNWHEIVNDRIGNVFFAVAYCPSCGSATAYDRTLPLKMGTPDGTSDTGDRKGRVVGGTTAFGVSGFLLGSDPLMYDRQTETLWNQMTGEAIVGELAGERLAVLSSAIARFSAVAEARPEAKVLSTETGYRRNY